MDKDLEFNGVTYISADKVKDMKPYDMSDIAAKMADAYNEALLHNIEANTLILNEKYAKTSHVFQKTPFGAWDIPPMFCGLRVEFTDLPEKFAFALANVPRKSVEEIEAEARKETAKEIFSYLYSIMVNANFASGNAEIPILKFFDKAKDYGIELFGNSDKLEEQ